MCRHRLSSSFTPGSVNSTAGKSITPAENTRAPAGVSVVAHLRAQTRAEEIRDPREHLCPRRRVGCGGVDLDPEAADLLAEHAAVHEARVVEQPRRRVDVAHDERPLPSRRRSRGTGRREAATRAARGPPLRDPADRVRAPVDLPEEVVRGEQDQAAAEVAVALDDVVGVLRTYSVWPGKTTRS